MGVRLLGALVLERVTIDGHDLTELSGLAWDHDEERLYALSDRGYVFHFRPEFADGNLVGVEALGAYALRDEERRALTGVASDAEGLSIEDERNEKEGDTRLIVSFERMPRIREFAPDGTPLDYHPLPSDLLEPDSYASSNKGLEAVTKHPKMGLLTAPEWPLRGTNPRFIPIYSTSGHVWRYPRRKVGDSALVALEHLPDGSIISLERSFSPLTLHLAIALRRITTLKGSSTDHALPVSDITVFRSSDGWKIDNFEGLTRHEGMRFFIVSDDNGRSLQKTVLVYLEVLETSPTR